MRLKWIHLFCGTMTLVLLCMFSISSARADDLSGAYFDPDAPGHGIIIDDGGETGFTVYWFLHDFDGEQLWLVSDSTVDGTTEDLTLFVTTADGFPQRGVELDAVGVLSVIPLAPNEVQLIWSFHTGECQRPQFSPMNLNCDGFVDLVRLSPRN